MNNFELLEDLISNRLGGQASRAGELFETEEVFKQLVALGRDSDWYHFKSKTYDGAYLVKDGNCYLTYLQERGTKSELYSFPDLQSAANHFFAKYW